MKSDCPTVIPYMGGKVLLSKKLIPMIPPHERYIEVFFGGGSMFFRKSKAEINILNDKHNDLINLYLALLHNYDEFKHNCEFLLKSRMIYNEYKNNMKKEIEYKDMPDAERASKYYYIIMNAFNNNFHNPIAKEKKAGHFDGWEYLMQSRDKLKNAMIENCDFRELYDRYKTKENDFWYFDPPYVIAGERGDYYFHSLKDKDHIDLFKIANDININGGKFMISYDDHPLVNELYKNYIIEKIPIKYSGQITGDDYKNELVIMNYKPINEQLTFI